MLLFFFFFPVEITLFQYAGYSSSVPAPSPFLLYTLTLGPGDWPEDPFDTCLLAEFGQWDAKVEHLSTRGGQGGQEDKGHLFGLLLASLTPLLQELDLWQGFFSPPLVQLYLTGFITQLLLSSLNFIWNLYFHGHEVFFCIFIAIKNCWQPF